MEGKVSQREIERETKLLLLYIVKKYKSWPGSHTLKPTSQTMLCKIKIHLSVSPAIGQSFTIAMSAYMHSICILVSFGHLKLIDCSHFSCLFNQLINVIPATPTITAGATAEAAAATIMRWGKRKHQHLQDLCETQAKLILILMKSYEKLLLISHTYTHKHHHHHHIGCN